LPEFSRLAIAVGLLALSVLGVAAARSTYGNPVLWAAALALAGGLLTFVGFKLRIFADCMRDRLASSASDRSALSKCEDTGN
jgi:hypothetical protein